jgi:hypothetical protein
MQVIFTTYKATSKFYIQVSQSKFIFMKILLSYNFKEFMIFLPKGLNPFKNSNKFQFEFCSIIYNSKYIEIWMLSQ